MINEVLEQLKARKSVRVYTDQPISPEIKDAILQSAFQAPTAGNMMLYTILDITDQHLKETLAVTCDNQPFISKAPVVLVFLADYQRWFDSFELEQGAISPEKLRLPAEGDLMLACCDALIAAQNAVVAAESMGIGSCYIGDILERYETHKDLFNLPHYVLPVAMLCFGYPSKSQIDRIKPKRFSKKYIVHENKYQRQTSEQLKEMFSSQSSNTENFDFSTTISAMLKRKWNCEFSEEMSRSVKKMIDNWVEE